MTSVSHLWVYQNFVKVLFSMLWIQTSGPGSNTRVASLPIFYTMFQKYFPPTTQLQWTNIYLRALTVIYHQKPDTWASTLKCVLVENLEHLPTSWLSRYWKVCSWFSSFISKCWRCWDGAEFYAWPVGRKIG